MEDKRIAVLIDADNVSGKYVQSIMDEIANYGTPTYKRIYADWTKPQLAGWKSQLLNYSITPIQQYGYTTGKNSTDAALIIDAMDILYSGNVDGFCIVSSDSDFTRLAARLREAGMYVIGMGEKKTPPSFIAACERFIYLEVISKESEKPSEEPKEKEAKQKKGNVVGEKKLVDVLRSIIGELSEEDGWAYLGTVGNVLSRRFPDFDTRNYGHLKLSSLINSMKEFKVQFRKTDNAQKTLAYVRCLDQNTN